MQVDLLNWCCLSVWRLKVCSAQRMLNVSRMSWRLITDCTSWWLEVSCTQRSLNVGCRGWRLHRCISQRLNICCTCLGLYVSFTRHYVEHWVSASKVGWTLVVHIGGRMLAVCIEGWDVAYFTVQIRLVFSEKSAIASASFSQNRDHKNKFIYYTLS